MTEGFDWHLAWHGFAYHLVPAVILYVLATGVACAFGRSTRRAAVVRFAFLTVAFVMLLLLRPPGIGGWTVRSPLFATALRNGFLALVVLWLVAAIRIPLTRRKKNKQQTAEPASGG